MMFWLLWAESAAVCGLTHPAVNKGKDVAPRRKWGVYLGITGTIQESWQQIEAFQAADRGPDGGGRDQRPPGHG
jgi:hypothetical protein